MALLCLVLGHDWRSFSVPATIPFLPDVTRVGKRVCSRCDRLEYFVNDL
jgi:hypothetical protein